MQPISGRDTEIVTINSKVNAIVNGGELLSDGSNTDWDELHIDGSLGPFTIDYEAGNLENGTVTFDLGGGATKVINFYNFEKVVCFTRGTEILTANGPCKIENLKTTDMVQTVDRGFQPVRWVGSTIVPVTPKNCPVLFRAGAIGNTSDLMLSQNHRILLKSSVADLYSDEAELLAAAKHFVNGTSITYALPPIIEYFHIVMDRHELIFSHGVASETLFLGKHHQASDQDLFNDQLRDFAIQNPDSFPQT